jgi:protein dithiol:quinone oxidoreductase
MKKLFMLGGALSVGLLGSAYFLEYYLHLRPCPLCYLQRYMLWGLCLFFWGGALHNPKSWGRVFYTTGILILSALGTLLAGRQVWLQYGATQPAPNCMAGFEKMLEFKPLFEVFKEIFAGTQDCAQVDFQFLSLSLAGWSLLNFIAFFVLSVWIAWLQYKRRI